MLLKLSLKPLLLTLSLAPVVAIANQTTLQPLPAAQSMQAQSLAIAEAKEVNRQAWQYQQQDDHNKAVALYKDSLALQAQALSMPNETTADTHTSIAFSYEALKQYHQALIHQQKALAIYQKTLGEYAFMTGAAYRNLAKTHEHLGDKDTANHLALTAIDIMSKAIEADDTRIKRAE